MNSKLRLTQGYTTFEAGRPLNRVVVSSRKVWSPAIIPEVDFPAVVAMGEGVRAGGSRHSRHCVGCGSRSWRIEDSGVDRPCWRGREQVVLHGRVSRLIARLVGSRPTMRVRHTSVPIRFMAVSQDLLGCWQGDL